MELRARRPAREHPDGEQVIGEHGAGEQVIGEQGDGEPRASRPGMSQPVLAGVLTALVGFTSSSAVVLAGLRGVGASPAQAASGLFALCAVQGIVMLWLSRRHRIPLTIAWSTPGAALLASTGVVHGGWPAAVGAFLIVAALIVATGLWPRLGRLIAAIPAPIAQAMLAGIVADLCLAPVRGIAADPWAVAPILLTWLVLLRLAPKWAVPGAFGVTLAVIAVDLARHGGVHGSLVPHLDWTAPAVTWASVLSIALPLYIVTMAGQNIPGVAVMATYGYDVPWRETMAVTGVATAVTATAGGHTLNLAAITASLSASPDADPDPGRRWIASFTGGWAYLVLGLLSAALTTLISAAPADVVATVAGLALLGTLAASLGGALSAAEGREAAVITFVVAASGLTLAGIGAAFWALVAGIGVRLVVTGIRSLPQAGGVPSAPDRYRFLLAWGGNDSSASLAQGGPSWNAAATWSRVAPDARRHARPAWGREGDARPADRRPLPGAAHLQRGRLPPGSGAGHAPRAAAAGVPGRGRPRARQHRPGDHDGAGRRGGGRRRRVRPRRLPAHAAAGPGVLRDCPPGERDRDRPGRDLPRRPAGSPHGATARPGRGPRGRFRASRAAPP